MAETVDLRTGTQMAETVDMRTGTQMAETVDGPVEWIISNYLLIK